jgi:DNA primase
MSRGDPLATDLPNDFREQVRAQTDIVGLIAEAMALQPRNGGREYAGLCPFHDDHDPSLRVYPDRQTYKCWVCNEGGDVFSWIQKREAVGFREALEILARRANIEIPKLGGRNDGPSDNKAALFEVLLWAEGIFHQEFVSGPSGSKARDYIRSRGFTAETVKKFRVGYHPNDWEWLQRQARGKFSNDQLEAVRLIGKRDGDRGYYDNFVDRVTFPIRNERGQVVGFGGRVLPGADDSHGKYWNSPESPVFFKSRLVYGLDFAREGLKQTGTAVVTEGYTDCIMCHQHGLSNVVGTLGTALTDQHVTTLKRFVKKVVLVYDGDNAGQRAAERAVERFVAQDVDLRIMTLPENKDPDEFLAAYGADEWRKLAETAPEAWEYKFQTLRKRYTLDTVSSRQQVLDEMLRVFATAPRFASHVREAIMLQNMAQRLRVTEEYVRERFREHRNKSVKPRSENEGTLGSPEVACLIEGGRSRDDVLECELLRVLIAAPEWMSVIQRHVSPEMFKNPLLRRLLYHCYFLPASGHSLAEESLASTIEDESLRRVAIALCDDVVTMRIKARIDDSAAATAGQPDQPSDPEADAGCPPLVRWAIDEIKNRVERSLLKRREAIVFSDGYETQLDAPSTELLARKYDFMKRVKAEPSD